MSGKSDCLKLFDFLYENLKFGCISEVHLHASSFSNGHCLFIVTIRPHSMFFENDLSFIRRSVFESDKLSSECHFRLKTLSLSSDVIQAVFKYV